MPLQRYRNAYARIWQSAVVVVAGLTLGCTAGLKESGFHISNYITRVTDAGGTIVAVLRTGQPPTPNGGPDASVSGMAAMVNGGSAQQSVSAAGSFATVVVAMPGYLDYYELTLPASALTAGLVLTAADNLPSTTLPINFAVANGSVLGNWASQLMRVIHVGTGDVQVSIAWSGASDVDLHIVDPNGEEVYYGNRTAASGGNLDLDSNAACSIDNKNNENIVWPTGQGVHGTYTVRVDYWDACGVTQSDFVVTVATVGGTPQVFTGSLTGLGDHGGLGSGQLITTFTY
jgi:hypothetical protein